MFAYSVALQAAGFFPLDLEEETIHMPDYYTVQQLAQTLGIAEAAITELQTKGSLQPTIKDGRSFFSARQVPAYVRLFAGHAKTESICKKLSRTRNNVGLHISVQ